MFDAKQLALQKYHMRARAKAHFDLEVKRLREQINSRATTVLLILLAASLLIFVIACSNVANLILARSVQRESELAVRAAQQDDSYRDHTSMYVAQEMIAAHTLVQPTADEDRGKSGENRDEKVVRHLGCPEPGDPVAEHSNGARG